MGHIGSYKRHNCFSQKRPTLAGAMLCKRNNACLFFLLECEDLEPGNSVKLVEISSQDGVAGGQRCRRDDQIVRADDLAAASEDR